MTIEAMKQALEAWQTSVYGSESHHKSMLLAMTNMAQAIAEAEKQEPVAHSVVAGALFDFMGWLTSRQRRLTLSSTDEAGPAVEAITEFAKMRGLRLEDAQVEHWQGILTTTPAAQPAQRQPLTDEQIDDIWNRYCDEMGEASINDAYDIARAIEAAHGITGEKT
jgi:hypothetical protein